MTGARSEKIDFVGEDGRSSPEKMVVVGGVGVSLCVGGCIQIVCGCLNGAIRFN